jgi:hypothetical protein
LMDTFAHGGSLARIVGTNPKDTRPNRTKVVLVPSETHSNITRQGKNIEYILEPPDTSLVVASVIRTPIEVVPKTTDATAEGFPTTLTTTSAPS